VRAAWRARGAQPNLEFVVGDIVDVPIEPQRRSFVACVHGCNEVTSTAVQRAQAAEAAWAVMPCCIRDDIYCVQVGGIPAICGQLPLSCARMQQLPACLPRRSDPGRLRCSDVFFMIRTAAVTEIPLRFYPLTINALATWLLPPPLPPLLLLQRTTRVADAQRYACMVGVLAGTYGATLVSAIPIAITNRNLCAFGGWERGRFDEGRVRGLGERKNGRRPQEEEEPDRQQQRQQHAS
jgi:hypothetical protein